MGLYNKYVVPRAVDWACGGSSTMKQREKIVPLARGHVLEIGIGSGYNLPYYDSSLIKSMVGVDPSIETWNRTKVDLKKLPFKFDYVQGSAENLPMDSNQFDTVMITYSMCTIPDIRKGLSEMRRVLKREGSLLFCEHGVAPDPSVETWQNRLNPIWKRIGGGCNLNRDIPKLIEENGFQITQLETMYIPGWKPASFNYWGKAVIRD